MNEKKDSVDKLLHLINNDISLIVDVPTFVAQFSAPALEENHDKLIKLLYCLRLLKLKTYVNLQINWTSRSR